MKSIIQQTKECYICRETAIRCGYYGILPDKGLHRHHVMHGTANRRLAEEYGLWVYLCIEHHEYGPVAVHNNALTDRHLKEIAQQAFESMYSHEKWMETFGKNYI